MDIQQNQEAKIQHNFSMFVILFATWRVIFAAIQNKAIVHGIASLPVRNCSLLLSKIWLESMQ